MQRIELIVSEENAGERLDQYLAGKLSHYSRNQVQLLIKDGNVTVDSKSVKPNHRTKNGEHVLVIVPEPKEIEIQPEKIDLDIVYEDSDIAVINKPQGMVVHPAAGNYTGTLVNALLYHCDELSGINGEIRPGIVHRIDKDTSGLLVIAKNDYAHRILSEQIQKKEASRIYLAVVHDNVKSDRGTICAPIGRSPSDRKKMAVVKGGRHAVTHYRVLERYGDYTFLELALETGRTHQIRVHLSYIGHPIVGDPVYGRRSQKFSLKGQALHAAVLTIVHPRTGESMEFRAPLPEYFEKLLNYLRNKSKNI
ncbi:MAG TPA: RluA family pseudouridine synthase [Clostridiales bacterium]|nr:RluA family pseudouridine synthase [Clostridiales bacterium]